MFLAGKLCPEGVVMLLLDLAFDVIKLKEAVMKVETTFVGAGIDVVVNNAACVHHNCPTVEISDDMLKVGSHCSHTGDFPMECSVFFD
ncbi:hypothetical protein CY35_14G016600 [Sphagnum magellanicum]|nr:hypothetical protein CY35_14G016600 [Sphagnum magellanicum]